MRIVIIGGVAAGMSAAALAHRLDPEAEIIVLEKGPHVSYGACGMPYALEDPDRALESLVLRDAETFRKSGIDVRTGVSVTRIEPDHHTLHYETVGTGRETSLLWDRLLIATGARAIRPPLPGMDLPGVFVLRQLTDGQRLESFIESRSPKRAVIIGAGYIGLEMAESLTHLGLEVRVVEREEQVVPGLDPKLAERIHETLVKNGVEVHTGVAVTGMAPDGSSLVVETAEASWPADLVLVAVGVRPNVELAAAAGLELGKTGAIAVNRQQQTSHPDIYAAGDCAEHCHRATGEPTWVPLGTTANKQGRVAGANLVGGSETFPGILGTAAFKVFEVEVGRTGLSERELAGRDDVVRSHTQHQSRGHGHPGGGDVDTVVWLERDGRILGAQMVGPEAVAARIDVFATAITAGMDAHTLSELDFAYAPPLAPLFDPILIAGRLAEKARSKKSHAA